MAKAVKAERGPRKASRSTGPFMPRTRPVWLYCHRAQLIVSEGWPSSEHIHVWIVSKCPLMYAS